MSPEMKLEVSRSRDRCARLEDRQCGPAKRRPAVRRVKVGATEVRVVIDNVAAATPELGNLPAWSVLVDGASYRAVCRLGPGAANFLRQYPAR